MSIPFYSDIDLNGNKILNNGEVNSNNQTIILDNSFTSVYDGTNITQYISMDQFNTIKPGDILSIRSGVSEYYMNSMIICVYPSDSGSYKAKKLTYINFNGDIQNKNISTDGTSVYMGSSGPDGGPKACFAGNTLVKTSNGYKEIRDIDLGDEVYSYNNNTNKLELKPVDKLVNHMSNDIYNIQLNNGITIQATWSHPFNVLNKGKVIVKDLVNGDVLTSCDNKTSPVIESINRLIQQTITYEIRIKDNNNYYITNSDIFVYNEESII